MEIKGHKESRVLAVRTQLIQEKKVKEELKERMASPVHLASLETVVSQVKLKAIVFFSFCFGCSIHRFPYISSLVKHKHSSEASGYFERIVQI